MTTSPLMKEIYAEILSEFAANNIEDTVENRLTILQGLFEKWSESEPNLSPSEEAKKCLYMFAVNMEILSLQLQTTMYHF